MNHPNPQAVDTTQQLAQSARRFSIGSLIAQVTSKLRDMLMANVFGTSAAISAFYFLFTLVSLIRRFMGKGIVHYIFVPQFESLRKTDPKRAFIFFRDLLSTVTAVLLSFTFLFEMGLWISLHFGSWDTHTCDTMRLAALVLPSVIFICLFGLSSALLSCEKKFFLSTVAPVGFNIVWIVSVWLLRDMEPKLAVTRLAITVGIAAFAQWFMTAPSVFRLLRSSISQQWWQNLKYFSQDLRILVKPLIYGSLGIGAMQINSMIDNLFAVKFVTDAGPSYLWFSIKMYQIPLDLFALALSVVLLPPLSRALEQNNPLLFRRLIDSSLRRAIYLMIPSSIFLVVLAGGLINTFYNRGAFTDLSVFQTTRCLMAYGVGLLPQTCVLMLVPACYAMGDYKVPVKAALYALSANIVLDGLFTCVFQWGVFSVALATSICTALNCYLLIKYLVSRLGMPLISTGFRFCVQKVMIAGFASGALTFAMGKILFQDNSFALFFSQTIPVFSRDGRNNWIQMGALAAIFIVSILLLYSAMRIKGTLEPTALEPIFLTPAPTPTSAENVFIEEEVTASPPSSTH